MNSMHIMIALLFFTFFCAAATLIIALVRSRNLKYINLLANINQKVFMTFWLGSFFASLYLLLNTFARGFLDKDFFLNAIAYGKDKPGTFFYLGGVCFVTVTLLVYIVRIAGKRVYVRIQNTRKP